MTVAKQKTVILGVTGSIAAYKTAGLASMLIKNGYNVHTIMTKNAANFINPIAFESLTGNKCIVDTFDRNFQFSISHISLAKQADVIMIAPASANVIGKLAAGIADDMLTTTVMAAVCKKIISPAMNVNMYNNPILQDNIKKLMDYGFEVVAPQTGYLACRAIGEGKMPEPETLFQYIEREAAFQKDLSGKTVLVTAGPTQEAIDPVRYITNHSTGKMGYEIARAAMLRGADVTLISGKTAIPPVPFVKMVDVTTAQDMFEAVKSRFLKNDIIIKSAAVADYTPKNFSENKMKKTDGDMSIPLERTVDILKYIGENRRPGQFICGFSMETENMLENSKAKLIRKNIDMIAANSLRVEGAGFGTDTNVITLIDRNKYVELDKMTKAEAAHRLLDEIKIKMAENA